MGRKSQRYDVFSISEEPNFSFEFQVLLSRNAKVYIAARDRRKAEEAIAELQGATTATGRAEFLNLDLADLTSVRSAAEEFTR